MNVSPSKKTLQDSNPDQASYLFDMFKWIPVERSPPTLVAFFHLHLLKSSFSLFRVHLKFNSKMIKIIQNDNDVQIIFQHFLPHSVTVMLKNWTMYNKVNVSVTQWCEFIRFGPSSKHLFNSPLSFLQVVRDTSGARVEPIEWLSHSITLEPCEQMGQIVLVKQIRYYAHNTIYTFSNAHSVLFRASFASGHFQRILNSFHI